MVCRSPKCEDAAVDGERWCETHGAQLRRVRRELEEEFKRMRGMRVSWQCKVPGCGDKRGRYSPFCPAHDEEHDE